MKTDVYVSNKDAELIQKFVEEYFQQEEELSFLTYPHPTPIWEEFFRLLQDLGAGRLYYKVFCSCCGPELTFEVTDKYFPASCDFQLLNSLQELLHQKRKEIIQYFINKIYFADTQYEKERYITLASLLFHPFLLPKLIAVNTYFRKR